MAVTMQQVREVLDPEEPNYQRGVALGPEALPHLDAIVSAGDPMLASKAAYLASLIPDPRAADVVEKAARSQEPVVRVAAAAAAANLGGDASDTLRTLASDPDAGVRKVAQARGRSRAAATPADPRTPGTQPGSSERIVIGRMPGEGDAGDRSAGAPASQDAGMPGEHRTSTTGLMPGEAPAGRSAAKGEMPR